MKTLHYIITIFLLAMIFFPSDVILAQNETQPTIEFDDVSYSTKNMHCDFYNTGKTSIPNQAHDNVIITVTDSNANKFSISIDRVSVYVWSDSDTKGIEITAYETGVNSGIFKGKITISDGQSTQDVIHVNNGDTLSARYSGTASMSHDATNHDITTTSFIGISCPPFERVPASSIRILDTYGNENDVTTVGKQVLITSNIANPTGENQNFTYIVQIQDQNGSTASLAWLSGIMLPNQTSSPSISWTPGNVGNYVASIFVWQSLTNPNALSAPLSADLTVLHDFTNSQSTIHDAKNLHCQLGFELMRKPAGGSPVCVTLNTAKKLVERGWALETNNPKLTHMNIKVLSSYTPSSLADHFLTGSLYSSAEPIQNGNITITVNGIVMGTTQTYPNGCFQFNNWNDSKLRDQINKSKSLGISSMELNFQTQYFGDSNHNPANASAASYLGFYAVPLAPAQYDTEVYPPNQINVTQGDSAQLHITVKPFSKYWEVGHMKLNLQRMPCGLSYDVSPVDSNDSVLVNNTASFDVVLNSTSYTPSGKYWISIDQDLSEINKPNIGSNIGAFFLNVLKK